jgi:serine/threonine-protein kinase
MLAEAYAGLGRKEDAIHYGEKALELDPIMDDAYERPALFQMLGFVYTKIGEYELAVDQIERLLTAPHGASAEYLRLDPRWDSLRDYPRFQRLLEEHSEPGS